MPQTPEVSAAVLIVEGDESVRTMLTVLLRREGYDVHPVCCVQATDAQQFDVILRDCSGAPAEHDASMREISACDGQSLRKTIVTTTAPRQLMEVLGDRVFAVLQKPFDVKALLRTIGGCARQSRRPAPARGAGVERTEEDSVEHPARQLRRFHHALPALRKALAHPAHSHRELLLQGEMRRTMRALSAVLHEAGRAEAHADRAAAYFNAAETADDLATPRDEPGH